jgi:hypothetical protein
MFWLALRIAPPVAPVAPLLCRTHEDCAPLMCKGVFFDFCCAYTVPV